MSERVRDREREIEGGRKSERGRQINGRECNEETERECERAIEIK